MIHTLNLTGIPPHHWVQPTTRMINYFYSYVPAAALAQITGPSISIMTIWWLHCVLQAIGYSCIATFIITHIARHALIGITALIIFYFGSSFGLIPGLANKMLHQSQGIDAWLRNWPGYQGVTCYFNALNQAMWTPHHVVALIAIMILPFLHWHCQGGTGWKILVSAMIIAYLPGGSTFLFVPFCAGMSIWIAWCGWRRDWKEAGYWCGAFAIASPFILPFCLYLVNGHTAGSRLHLAAHAFLVSQHRLVNCAMGIGLEFAYLALQFGLLSVAFMLVLRQIRREGTDPETVFYLTTGGVIVPILWSCASGANRDEINDWGVRGLLIPAMFFTLALCKLSPETTRRIVYGKRKWIWIALTAYSLLPTGYGYVASLNYQRRLTRIPDVAVWANRMLPMNAVVMVDNRLLQDNQADFPTKTPWWFVMRQKWIPYSLTLCPERSTMDVTHTLETFPSKAMVNRPIYRLRLAGSEQEANTCTRYQDFQYAIDEHLSTF
jgi:hypothetical protein